MLNIGSRLELFVDGYLIERMEGTELRLWEPQAREVVFEFNVPWEGSGSAYATVFEDEGRYRMYYRGSGRVPDGTAGEQTCMAESDDGVIWTRPELGLFEHRGSTANNIVWDRSPSTHNFAPFKDTNPSCPAEERYKALAYGALSKEDHALCAFVSPDGVRWTPMEGGERLITEGLFDSLNVAFWDAVAGCYVCYLRDFTEGIRAIRRCVSEDFGTWSTPEWFRYGDVPLEQFYTNSVVAYPRAPHIYLSFPKRFVPERHLVKEHESPGVSDGVFMSSRDGLHWDRTFLEAFVRPGRDRNNWTQRSNMAAWGILRTAEDELSMYYSEHYSHLTNRLRRRTLRLDGFVSVRADGRGGEMVTRPLVFAGKELVLNVATSAAGMVRVEIQDEKGQTVPGYELEACSAFYGDEIESVVQWTNGPDVGELAGRPVRLRFAMRGADLYSMRFR